MKSFRATVLLIFALISFSSISAFADCSQCPRTANSCTVGGVTYTHCFNGMNGIYYTNLNINTACNPTNPNNPTAYFGYPFSIGGVTKYSSCYSGATAASDCFPPSTPPGTSSTPNCQNGKFSISMYDASGNLKGTLYCSSIRKDAFTSYRGDLYHNCTNTTYGGPFQMLPSLSSSLPRSTWRRIGPLDPLTLACAALVVLLLALVASRLPAGRAASIDPTRAQ